MTSLAQKYTLFPIPAEDEWAYKMYKQQLSSFWTVEEIILSQDKIDWAKLTENEQKFIKMILAFFAGSDGIVQDNLVLRFQGEVQSPSQKLFYGFQNAMEGVHSETYSLLIDKFVEDKDEKLHLLSAIDTIPCISQKAAWALKWMNSSESFATRLVAFSCVEGIFFSGAFCAIYWLKKRGLMPGLTFSNELISRDEGLHTLFATTLYSKLPQSQKLQSGIVEQIIESAVEIETNFICESLPCSLIGMNSRDMTAYIKFVANRLIVQLGGTKIWDVSNPFDFMELISLEGKTNFFEKKVGEYTKPGVGVETSAMEIKFDSEF